MSILGKQSSIRARNELQVQRLFHGETIVVVSLTSYPAELVPQHYQPSKSVVLSLLTHEHNDACTELMVQTAVRDVATNGAIKGQPTLINRSLCVAYPSLEY